MFDFSTRLRENAHLLSLLSHYAQIGAEDREAWQARLMQMDGLAPKDLTALHGELIAFDWIEQNTGHASFGPDGVLSACYRVTRQGLRDYRRLHGIEAAEEPAEPTEDTRPKFPRRKKDKPEPAPAATAAAE
jgi:hypothetical protein